MISPKVKAGCGVLTVLGLGFALGFFCLLIILGRVIPLSEGWKSERSKEFIANHFANQWDLTDEQREQFRPLVDEALEKRWALRRDYLLKDQQMLEEEIFPKVKELLTPAQKEKAAKMLKTWRDRQKSKVEGKPPTPGEKSEEKSDGKTEEKTETSPAPPTEG